MNPKEIQQEIKRLSTKIHQTAEQLNSPVSKIEIDILRKLCMEQYDYILMLSASSEEQQAYSPTMSEDKRDGAAKGPMVPAGKAPAPVEKEAPRRTDDEYEELLKEYQDLLAQHKKNLEESARAKEPVAEPAREKPKKVASSKSGEPEKNKATDESPIREEPIKEVAGNEVTGEAPAKEATERVSADDGEGSDEETGKDVSAETSAGKNAADEEDESAETSREAPSQDATSNGTVKEEVTAGTPAKEEATDEVSSKKENSPGSSKEESSGSEKKESEPAEGDAKAEPVKPEDFYNKSIPPTGPEKKEPGSKEAEKTEPVAQKEEKKKEEVAAEKVKPAAEKARPPSVNIYKLEKMVAEEETVKEAVHHVGPLPVVKEESWKASEPKREASNKKPAAEPEPKKEQEAVPVNTATEEKPVVSQPEPVKTANNVPQEEIMDLNRKLGETLQNKDLHTRLRETPIPDLKSAITINKKIAFMNNLFESSIDKYDNAIALLNSSQTLTTALQHFSGLRMAYNWGSENELAEELEELIRRRYS